MLTARIIATAAVMAVAGLSPALAQDSQGDAHHPAASADPGGSTSAPSPEAVTPPAAMPPMPGAGGMASPEMAPMMSTMMRSMCATMMGGRGEGMMAGRHAQGTMPDGPTDPVTAAFDAINRRMHEGMAVDASDGADRAFAQAMIAHHQGAIDMAKVILGFGADPRIRTLAEAVIKAQGSEIAVLRQWLAEQPQP